MGMGAIFFGEFSNISSRDLILFLIAIGLTVFGVAVLAFEMGSVYGRMVKKIEDKTGLHLPSLSQEQKAKSIRSIALESMKKTASFEQGKHQLEFPAFFGAVSSAAFYQSNFNMT